MNKKDIILKSAVLVVILVGLIVFVLSSLERRSSDADLSLTDSEVQCENYTNLDSIIAARNSDLCKCLQDEEESQLCSANIVNAILYQRAAEEINLDLCDEITNTTLKETCVLNVNAAIQFEEENPNPYDEHFAETTIEDREADRVVE